MQGGHHDDRTMVRFLDACVNGARAFFSSLGMGPQRVDV